MSDSYQPNQIESKWSQKWMAEKAYKAQDGSKKAKSYIMIEFPYPSGERLHVGHARSYSCLDAVARKRRMEGKNVMFPFGWDAFGLPAENYAVKTGIHPAITTKKNIENAKKQAISWGLSFDWDREINTTDPNYYKWTQWIFGQLFKHGLAYKDEIAVNWCPSCKINLANEEVIDGKCERCGTETERRKQAQWLLAITTYADRLEKDLQLVNYREDIAAQQVNWIGRKEGINITYPIEGRKDTVTVFTTRPDTNFGATFVVLAPEHPLAGKAAGENPEVAEYIAKAKNKSERERQMDGRKKTGVETGWYAINHLTSEKMPVWVADFVLMGFGTGAVVGVPGHDMRDFEFAQAMNLPIKRVVVGPDKDETAITESSQVQEEEGVMVNSGFLDGMDIHTATTKIMDYMEEHGWGKRTNSYHLRDWVFSRQHYWGEPIPMVFCPTCAKTGTSWFTSKEAADIAGTSTQKPVAITLEKRLTDEAFLKQMAGWYPVSEADLPVKLPDVERYQPTETGESPLAHIESWVQTVCPGCGGAARRETDTMPNWAGSSWYYLRYTDPHNDTALADKTKLDYWLPVDWYNGGMEHTTLHLLYSRFWHKFLFDLGVVSVPEPYAKRTSHGVILGPDGRKMSKSKGNVINPDDVVNKYGADTLRLYEMFIGPFDQALAWSWESLEGVHRFLKRVWVLVEETRKNGVSESSAEAKRQVAQLIVKVSEDLEATKFNTAVAANMEFVNWWSDHRNEVGTDCVRKWILVTAPLAPFITEELWNKLHGSESGSVHTQKWPEVTEAELAGGTVTVVIQVNGKLRDRLTIEKSRSTDQKYIEQLAEASDKVKPFLSGKSYKTIFVPGRIINLVI